MNSLDKVSNIAYNFRQVPLIQALKRWRKVVLGVFLGSFATILLFGGIFYWKSGDTRNPHVIDVDGLLSPETRKVIEAEASVLERQTGISFVLHVSGIDQRRKAEIEDRILGGHGLTKYQENNGIYTPTVLYSVWVGKEYDFWANLHITSNLWLIGNRVLNQRFKGQSLDDLALAGSRATMGTVSLNAGRFKWGPRALSVPAENGLIMTLHLTLTLLSIFAALIQASLKAHPALRVLNSLLILVMPASLLLLVEYLTGWPEGFRIAFYALGSSLTALTFPSLYRAFFRREFLYLLGMFMAVVAALLVVRLLQSRAGSVDSAYRYFSSQWLTTLDFWAILMIGAFLGVVCVATGLAVLGLDRHGRLTSSIEESRTIIHRALRGWRPIQDPLDRRITFREWLMFYNAPVVSIRLIGLFFLWLRMYFQLAQMNLFGKILFGGFHAPRLQAASVAMGVAPRELIGELTPEETRISLLAYIPPAEVENLGELVVTV